MKNQLGIVLGFAELMLTDAAVGERHRQDLEDILSSANAAMALMCELEAAEGAT